MSILADPFFLQFSALAAAAAGAAILSSWALRNAFGPRRAEGMRETLAAWLPLALTVLIIAPRHPSLALTLIYSSSVAALTLLLGSSLYFTARLPKAALVPDDSVRPALPLLLLPLVIMLWIIGFAGRLEGRHALAVAIAGLAIGAATWPGGGAPSASRRWHARLAAIFEGGLGILAGVGAAAAGFYLGDFAQNTGGRLPVELVAVTPLAPLLGIPLYVAVARLVQGGGRKEATTLACSYTLLNLALLLPALFLISTLSRVFWSVSPDGDALVALSTAFSDAVVGIPLILWRIENVILLIAVLALAGLKIGYYQAGRALGAGLLFLYIVYLFCSIALRLA